jgi:hypothetical protein
MRAAGAHSLRSIRCGAGSCFWLDGGMRSPAPCDAAWQSSGADVLWRRRSGVLPRSSWGAGAQGRRGDAVFAENEERPFGEAFAANRGLAVPTSSCQELADTAQGLNRLRENSGPGRNGVPQGLKPDVFSPRFTARLKSCPDTKHQSRDSGKTGRFTHSLEPLRYLFPIVCGERSCGER